MSPQLSPEQFLWMEVFLFPWRTILPVIMWWNGMMPCAGRTVLWTGSRWRLQTTSPLLNQVCQRVRAYPSCTWAEAGYTPEWVTSFSPPLLFSAQSPPHWAVTTPHIYCSVSFLLLFRVTLVCSLFLQPTSSRVWDTTFPCTVALQRLHSCCSAGRDTCKSWVRVRLHMGQKFIILSSF